MATTTYGTEYVQSSDLVSNWPGSSLSVANRIDDVSLVGNGVNNQTGTSYTLVLADGGKLVTFSNAAAVSLTVPTNSSVAFPTGVRIKLTNKGAGTVTVAGAGGVTLNGNQLTIAQNRSAMLYKLDTNTWVMTADPTDPGLVYITNSTFSAVSSVSVNNCFSATYDNYRIVVREVGSETTSVGMRLRLRASGSDATGANYIVHQMATTNTAGPSRTYVGNETFATIGAVGNSANSYGIDLVAPYLADFTRWNCTSVSGSDNNNEAGLYSGIHKLNSSYDGMTLYPSAGTITGSLRIYGYRNSL